jgi:hypothetical protein
MLKWSFFVMPPKEINIIGYRLSDRGSCLYLPWFLGWHDAKKVIFCHATLELNVIG